MQKLLQKRLFFRAVTVRVSVKMLSSMMPPKAYWRQLFYWSRSSVSRRNGTSYRCSKSYKNCLNTEITSDTTIFVPICTFSYWEEDYESEFKTDSYFWNRRTINRLWHTRCWKSTYEIIQRIHLQWTWKTCF